MAIAVYFIDILDAPHESEWDGQDGTVAIIHREKKMKPGSQAIIRKVLADVVKCHEKGLEYTGEAKGTQGGHNKLIELDSVEMQLAADVIEANQGYTQATSSERVSKDSRDACWRPAFDRCWAKRRSECNAAIEADHNPNS